MMPLLRDDATEAGMEETPRIVGIDYGSKRVGIAISDPLRLFAQPVSTVEPEDVLSHLKSLQDTYGIERIVIGWPLTLEGDDGTAMALVQPFVERLRRRFPNVEIVKWDERFTTEEAKRTLFDAGVSRRARRDRKRINAAAAAVILQEYLSGTSDADASESRDFD